MREPILTTLIDMHSYKRPAGSATEHEFIDKYVATLPGAHRDPWGNWRVVVDDTPVLWSCHTDTVHYDDGRQTTHYDDATGILALSRFSKHHSGCLGADDTAGVFIMCEMIKRAVPGTYVFHYGEEKGCIGSRDLAEFDSLWLQRFDMAIALDRGGCQDVITYQIGDRCASDAFARSLANELHAVSTITLSPAHGIYTDTASYVDLIPECTNLSVGYSGAHGRSESLNCWHVLRLLDALCRLDTDMLTVDRDPDADAALANVFIDIDDCEVTTDCGDWRYLPDRLPEVWDDDYTGDDSGADYYLDPAYAQVQLALRRWNNAR